MNKCEVFNTEINYIKNEKYKKYCVYDRAKSVTISSDKPLTISIDGEIFRNKDVKIEVLKHAVNFVIPSNI